MQIKKYIQKSYFLIILCVCCMTNSFASYEQVRVGTIDDYYKSTISKSELKDIILEIEQKLESQVGFNLFDYSNSGKPIDIIYLPPAKMEKRIFAKQKLIKRKKVQIDNAKHYFSKNQSFITKKQNELNSKTRKLNQETNALNRYIKDANRRKDLTRSEYERIQSYVENKQKTLQYKINQLQNEKKSFQDEFNNYNRKVYNYNSLIREYNHLNKELARLTRSYKKVKGRTFGYQEVSLKTYYENGKKIKEKKVKNSMNKIEIYGFDSLGQLKATIAHEIGHLVGIPHIRDKKALMNPILQENQIQKLHLIGADIRNFKKNF